MFNKIHLSNTNKDDENKSKWIRLNDHIEYQKILKMQVENQISIVTDKYVKHIELQRREIKFLRSFMEETLPKILKPYDIELQNKRTTWKKELNYQR